MLIMFSAANSNVSSTIGTTNIGQAPSVSAPVLIALKMIWPRSITPPGPSPITSSPTRPKIAPSADDANPTPMNGSRFGSSSVTMISRSRALLTRARSTYGRDRRLSTCARIVLAANGQEKIEIITPTWNRLTFFAYADNAISNGNVGMTNRMPVNVDSTPSTQPPLYPATNATITPATVEITPAIAPICNDTASALTTIANTSRPN